jgi:protein arginine kinase activator
VLAHALVRARTFASTRGSTPARIVNCEKCKQAPASVHVTELRPLPEAGAPGAAANGTPSSGEAGKSTSPSSGEASKIIAPSSGEASNITTPSSSEASNVTAPSSGETASTKQPSASEAASPVQPRSADPLRDAQQGASGEPSASEGKKGSSQAPKSAGASDAPSAGSARPAPKQPPAKPPAKAAKAAASKSGAGEEAANGSPYALTHVHLCAGCADKLDLWHSLPVVNNKGVHSIWKLLQSAKAGHSAPELSCPACGMTLAEFRAKGRLGCPNDYEVFRAHLNPLLKRMHNATEHVGRLPGVEAGDLERQRRIHALRAQLDAAVRDEAYEHAARLRDELQQLDPRREG